MSAPKAPACANNRRKSASKQITELRRPDGKGPDHGATSLPLIGTAYCYLNVKLMARTAQRLGRTEDQKHYTELADRIRSALNERFLNTQTAQYESATQTSYVLPVAFGLVPDEILPRSHSEPRG